MGHVFNLFATVEAFPLRLRGQRSGRNAHEYRVIRNLIDFG
jgi:hypothetical protein